MQLGREYDGLTSAELIEAVRFIDSDEDRATYAIRIALHELAQAMSAGDTEREGRISAALCAYLGIQRSQLWPWIQSYWGFVPAAA